MKLGFLNSVACLSVVVSLTACNFFEIRTVGNNANSSQISDCTPDHLEIASTSYLNHQTIPIATELNPAFAVKVLCADGSPHTTPVQLMIMQLSGFDSQLLTPSISTTNAQGIAEFQVKMGYAERNFSWLILPVGFTLPNVTGMGLSEITFQETATALGVGTFQAELTTAIDVAAVPRTPLGIAVGDFNHDGNLDTVAASTGGNTVSVMMGRGDGTFDPAVLYTSGADPAGVAVGDLNSDAILDLVVANSGDNTVGVLLGVGDGTFQSPTTYTVGNYPYAIALGDFNRDGKLDVAATNYSDATVSILLGAGNGVIGNAGTSDHTLTTHAGALELALGDLNHDGILDLAVSSYSGDDVSIFLGLGDGNFGVSGSQNSAVLVGSTPYFVVLADFNNDGDLDLATANFGSDDVSVALGAGDGTFGASTQLSSGGNHPYGLSAGDLNGDGNLDLVTSNGASSTMSVFMGAGNGSFVVAMSYTTGSAPYCLALGDFDNNQKLDVITGNIGASSMWGVGDPSITVMLGD